MRHTLPGEGWLGCRASARGVAEPRLTSDLAGGCGCARSLGPGKAEQGGVKAFTAFHSGLGRFDQKLIPKLLFSFCIEMCVHL